MSIKSEKTSSGTTSIKLGQSRKDLLAQLAQRKKRSAHSLVLEAVDLYIQHQQAVADFEDQAIRSYEQMRATGMHVTLEEMQAWLRELETNPNAPFPKSHS
jgi:predicted transcriptional regulator